MNLNARIETRSPRIAYLISYLPLILTLVVFLLYFLTYLVYARALFNFPFDYDQGEGFELYDAIRLSQGHGIYLDNARFPYYSSNYPPIYRLMLAPLVLMFGPHVWVGRAVTFGTSLIIGALIFYAAQKQFVNGKWLLHSIKKDSAVYTQYPEPNDHFPFISLLIPLITALAFFAANYVYHIGPLARAHLPMVMFAFAGVVCIERGIDERRMANDEKQTAGNGRRKMFVVVGVTFLLIAGFTKLQAIDAMAAGFGYLLLRKPKWCVVALVTSAIATTAVVVWLNAITQGNFWLNIVLANVNEYNIEQTWQTYRQWFQLQSILIACSAIYVVWDVVRAVRARSFKPITIWSLYFLAGSAMGMLTGKWGAGPTYLIAAIAASCVCAARLFSRIQNFEVRSQSATPPPLTPHSSRLAPLSSLLFCFLLLWQAALNIHLPTSGRFFGTVARAIGVADKPSSYPPYPYYDSIGYTQLGHLLDTADTVNGHELVKIIQSAKRPVWSEEAMLPLIAGKEVVTNPTQLFNLDKNNMLDTRDMIARIERKEFGAVVFRAQFYPDDVKAAIGANYHWATTVKMNGFDYWVLMPNE